MKERRNHSDRASVLQITLSAGLISISAIILASSFNATVYSGVELTQTASQSRPERVMLAKVIPAPRERDEHLRVLQDREDTSASMTSKPLSFTERVTYQYAIEEVYWRHRIWPKENPGAKPSLEAVMSPPQVEKKVTEYLRSSQLLADQWHRPITPEQLQAEVERMATHTRNPEMLRELFAALGNDPAVIAQCLAQPVLTERLLSDFDGRDETHPFSQTNRNLTPVRTVSAVTGKAAYELPEISSVTCTDNTWTPTINVPVERSSHSAVWTGSEMIVWGGVSVHSFNYEYVNSGARYDPATDSWRVINMTNAPAVRYGHTTVWTGTQMIVFGGLSLGSPFYINTGAKYDPAADSWTPISTINGPSPRASHTAVWTGSEMIVWGGSNSSPMPYLNTGGRYDPVLDSWTVTAMTNAPVGRQSHTAVWTGDEMIVWGGYTTDAARLASGGKYNPSTDSWVATSMGSVPSSRYNHTAVWTGSEMIVWGGNDSSPVPYLNSGGRYNPITNNWVATSITNAAAGRYLHTAVWTGNEMLVWGGIGSSFTLNSGGRYNPATDTWILTSNTNAPPAAYAHTAVWTGSEMIIHGGQNGTVSLNTGGRYNPATNGWIATRTTNAPAARARHTAVWTGAEMVVWGAGVNTGGKYDPATDTWTATNAATAPVARSDNTAVWTGSEMIIWGGWYNNGAFNVLLNDGGRYNPATNSWTAPTTTGAPIPRRYHTGVWTGSEMIVWGGEDTAANYLNTGGRYAPSTNTWIATSITGAPAAREGHIAVWSGSQMIVWGGGPFSLNTGGKYDPSTNSWTPTSTTSVPTARGPAIWTGSEMIVWGGSDNTGGKYNPSTNSWTATTTTNAPIARGGHTAIWTGVEMIVWGGSNGIGSYLDTGGRYSPSADSWAATNTTNAPSARSQHTAIWTGKEMIVWGGENGIGLNTGGKYCVTGPPPTPTPTPTPTPPVEGCLSASGPGTPPPTTQKIPMTRGTDSPVGSALTNYPVRHFLGQTNEGCSSEPTQFPPDFFNGSVALIRRGGCTFTEKITNAFNAGATLVAIRNNQAGTLFMSTVGQPNIPAYSMDQIAGEALVAFVDANATDATVNFDMISCPPSPTPTATPTPTPTPTPRPTPTATPTPTPRPTPTPTPTPATTPTPTPTPPPPLEGCLSTSGPGTPPPTTQNIPMTRGTDSPVGSTLTNYPVRHFLGQTNEGCSSEPTQFPPDFFNGSVALIRRGGCSFTEKITNAFNAGATFVAIGNNQPGTVFMSTPGQPNIPAYSMDQTPGDALAAFVDANPTNATVIFDAISCPPSLTPTPSPTPVTTPTPTPRPTPTQTPTPTPRPTPSPGCPTTVTQSTSQTITPGLSVSCNDGFPGFHHTDNSYWRAFNMNTFVGGAQYFVTSVSFGIETAAAGSGGSQPVTVRLYANNGSAFPNGTRSLLGSAVLSVPNQTATLFGTQLAVTVPAGTLELVMEVFTPNGQAAGNNFFIGSNGLGQTGPSYISAADCGVTNPTDLAAIGFPNVHIVMNVHGICADITPTPTPTPSPTPTPPETPTPSPTPTPTPAASPTLGNYPDTSVPLSDNATVTPGAPPSNTTAITVSTATDFKGTLEGDPVTGVVRVTDAHPAGVYAVTVRAFNGVGASTTTQFTLTVTTPATCDPLTFAPANNFDTGPFPISVAVGDFNGDGKQDLAVANLNSSIVSILLGNGMGGFGGATDFGVGNVPFSVAVGDFNGDGKQDLAVANSNSNNVSIRLGNGMGGFSAATNFGAGSGPTSVAVGDFNGDGKQDLAVANRISNNVSILLGNGMGGFGGATNFGAGTSPQSLAIGDFNGDGKQDLAVANNLSDNVSILLGNGMGGFSAATNFGVGTSPRSVAVGDFNGDGKQDLAVANLNSNNVSILLGNGMGGFGGATNFGVHTGPFSVALGDFNGDSKQDLAVANVSSNDMSILLGDGMGAFGGATSFGVGNGPRSVAVGDFNGDGKQDLAVANSNSNNVSILLRDCALSPTGAVSRKAHGDTGTFDIDLPLSGPPGIECRTGGSTGDYTIVVTFGSAVTITGNPQAQVVSGTATVGSGGTSNGGMVTISGTNVTVPLTNVANAQTINVRLNGVTGSSGSGNITIPMSILVGDTNANGAVNSEDVAQAKARLGQALDATNFRSDVNANAAINAGDVSQIKSQLGTGLP